MKHAPPIHMVAPASHTKIRTKITVGHLLAVSIPVMGACLGLMVGDRYQKSAIQTLTDTYQDKALLRNLELKILETRLTKELGPFVEDRADFERAVDSLLKRVSDIQDLSQTVQESSNQSVIAFRPKLEQYQTTLLNFSQDLEQLKAENHEGRSSLQLEASVIALAKRGKTFNDFIRFSDQVDTLTAALRLDILMAQNELQQAEQLRIAIIVGSLVASILGACLLSLMTSRAIARPLESLSKVAQTVTDKADTRIRANVDTNDEIGTLAASINQLIGWVETYTTELKETQQQQVKLIQAEKMSSVEQLVAGVAHEINNPVGFIHGNITPIRAYIQDLLTIIHSYQAHYPNPPQSIQETLDDVELDFVTQDLADLLQSMTNGTTRIKDIVLSLRNFSRLDESDFKLAQVHEGIDNTLLILDHRLNGDCSSPTTSDQPAIEVIKSYEENLPPIECLPGPLNQVFMNVLINAIDALEAASKEQLDQPRKLWISTQLKNDNLIQIVIADNGMGMSESVRSQIFEPFFTTKPVGQGTGLGLSISYQIITEQHGGHMTCSSIHGKGTQFLIDLPIQHAATT